MASKRQLRYRIRDADAANSTPADRHAGERVGSPSCEWCASVDLEEVDRYGLHGVVVVCRNCAHEFVVWPIPMKEKV